MNADPLGGMRGLAAHQCSKYGYTISETGRISTPSGKETGIFLSYSKGYYRARSADGKLYWSGDQIGKFLEKFWYAKQIG